jgi:hypothetical protein
MAGGNSTSRQRWRRLDGGPWRASRLLHSGNPNALLALDAVRLVRLNPSIRGASTARREPGFLVMSCMAKRVAQ